MNDADLKSALDALALTEADSDDVRLVADDDYGALLIAHYQTAKHGTHLVLLAKDKKATSWTRTRLCGRHMHALYQTLAGLIEE
jgi:hypothetical protein